jgi:gentisate 1,2-dioxygenase
MSDRPAFSSRAADLGLTEYWLNRDTIEDPAFRPRAVPFCWRWRDMRPLLEAAAHEVPMELAYRRALLFMNPGLKPRPFITGTLYGGCSWYNPGERAEVHRHAPSASRFVLAGDGGFTNVDGEKCVMARGDLILTPNGTWHDHGNEGREPVIWIDLLDLPLVETLNPAFVMEYEYREAGVQRKVQTVTKTADYSVRLYGAGGLKPKFVPHQRGQGVGSPMFVYRWHDTLEAFERLKDFAPDECDGHALEYVNPATGEACVPTLSFAVQRHAAGSAPKWKRTSASTVFCVIEGSGRTELEQGALDWSENDLFVVPSGTWYRNVNAGTGDLLLYAVSDEPVHAKLGLLQVEMRQVQTR